MHIEITIDIILQGILKKLANELQNDKRASFTSFHLHSRFPTNPN